MKSGSHHTPALNFFHPDGVPIEWGELDSHYLRRKCIGASLWDRQISFLFKWRKKTKGNGYFYNSIAELPLPDGLETIMSIDDLAIHPDHSRSQKTEIETIRFRSLMIVQGDRHLVEVFLHKRMKGIWVIVRASKNDVLKNPISTEAQVEVRTT
jgi:hypothetical protein